MEGVTMTSGRMRLRVRIACEHLLNYCGGCRGNARYETILIAAITSAPVCKALADSISYYSDNYEDAREKARIATGVPGEDADNGR